MSEFSNLENKAESYAEEHPEQADKGIDEAAKFAEHETGDKHDSEIQRAEQAAEQHIGGGQSGQGQDQQGGQSGQGQGQGQ